MKAEEFLLIKEALAMPSQITKIKSTANQFIQKRIPAGQAHQMAAIQHGYNPADFYKYKTSIPTKPNTYTMNGNSVSNGANFTNNPNKGLGRLGKGLIVGGLAAGGAGGAALYAG